MGSWVEEFDSFQMTPSSFDLPSGVPRKLHSKKEQLEAELKLLQWHKLANEAAIKAALLQTKTIKKSKTSSKPVPVHTVEDAKWMRTVIAQEKAKPLQVSKDFVITYDKTEKRHGERMSEHVDRHISTLKTLRDKIEGREDIISRNSAYRAWKKGFNPKKRAVLLGRADEIESSSNSPYKNNNINDRDSSPAIHRQPQHKELNNVLESLKKLSELENRIASLERDNVYETIKNDSTGNIANVNVDSGTKLQFKKQKISSRDDSSRFSYSINVKRGGGQSRPGNVGAKKINSKPVRIGKGVRPNVKAATIATSKQGVFLTEFETNERHDPQDFRRTLGDEQARMREELRRERQRNLALAPAGQKTLRRRIQDKKQRIVETKASDRKHEIAVQEILKRRQEKPNINKIYGSKTTKGASSGVRSGNKYMNEFVQLKNGLQRKKDDFKLAMDRDFHSRTRPQDATATRENMNSFLPPINRRMPLTKTSGTSTRKIDDVPIRRRILGQEPDFNTAPAVIGVNSLRMLRAMS